MTRLFSPNRRVFMYSALSGRWRRIWQSPRVSWRLSADAEELWVKLINKCVTTISLPHLLAAFGFFLWKLSGNPAINPHRLCAPCCSRTSVVFLKVSVLGGLQYKWQQDCMFTLCTVCCKFFQDAFLSIQLHISFVVNSSYYRHPVKIFHEWCQQITGNWP